MPVGTDPDQRPPTTAASGDTSRTESSRGSGITSLDDLLAGPNDEDIADAMRDIPGYLDISLQDFRELYRASVSHALSRLAGHPAARALMRTNGPRLTPEQPLTDAIAAMAAGRTKSAAVVDGDGRVVGILTETDVLRHLGAESMLELLRHLVAQPGRLERCCSGVAVSSVMTRGARTVHSDTGLPAIMHAFAAHPGRAMPVVDTSGRLLGMLARKDLVHACGLSAIAP